VYFNKKVYNDNGNVIHNSTRVRKKNIEDLSESYSILFDHLRPVRFQYKHDDEQVYHLGYILEELGEAMALSNLDPSELGAYCPNP
jgi:hypothetical protein